MCIDVGRYNAGDFTSRPWVTKGGRRCPLIDVSFSKQVLPHRLLWRCRLRHVRHRFRPAARSVAHLSVVTRIEMQGGRQTQAWVPVPAVNGPGLVQIVSAAPGRATAALARARSATYGAEMLHVEWPDGEEVPSSK